MKIFIAGLILSLAAAAASPAWSQNAEWPDLSVPARLVGGGEHDAAVIVGAENYAFVEHVPGARKNANDWQAYLTGTLKVPADRVALLLDNDATHDSIRQAAAEKAAQVEPGGTLWFVFIGHGAPSKDGNDGLLVGVDAQQKTASVYSRSLSRNELLGVLAKGRQAKTVVLLDACFSGKSPSGQALVAGLQPLIAMRALPLGIDNRTVLMTAAKSDQFAGPLPGGSRPAFSYLALGALRGWAADAQGKVTAAGLVDYVRRTLSLARDRTQTPELSTPEAAATVLGTGHEAGPDLAKLQREAASSSGGFEVTSLAAVPTVQAPGALDSTEAGGLDFRNVDVQALDKYNAAFELDRGAGASAEDKAASWRRLAKDAPKLAEMAGKRAAQWEAFAAQKKAADEARQKRVEARDADWEKLGHLLTLAVVPETDKRAWSSQFVKAYLKSPGVEPGMAKGLAAQMPAGPTKEALRKLAATSATTAGKAGIQWVRIPGGTFTMGSGNGDAGPAHSVTITSFQLAKTAVTNKQYQACVDAAACMAPEDKGAGFKGDDQPVVGVDWNQAAAFSKWAGGRLPTEAEWEYAARSGGKDWVFPWGNEDATCERAVILGCAAATAPACSKPAGNTKQGLCDMAGNVWEWVRDWHHDSYRGAPADGRSWEDPKGSSRVLRGGSWGGGAGYARSSIRYAVEPGYRGNRLGFRPAR
jgi:formylglycine-generating enzyme required for sulfatase activity